MWSSYLDEAIKIASAPSGPTPPSVPGALAGAGLGIGGALGVHSAMTGTNQFRRAADAASSYAHLRGWRSNPAALRRTLPFGQLTGRLVSAAPSPVKRFVAGRIGRKLAPLAAIGGVGAIAGGFSL